MFKLKYFLQTKPIFVCLLPVFFVLHGFNENFDFIPVTGALLLVILYTGVSIILALLSWLIFRNFHKANLLAFFIMCFHFFFGSIHDSLKNIFPGMLITRYSFIIPVIFIVFILMIVLLKRTKKPLLKLTGYLNLLLLFLLLIDAGWLLSKIIFKKNQPFVLGRELIKCESCAKPDIYFILTDEYAGYNELKNVFHYDNSSFENDLRNRGFHIINNSFSNYNYTPFSLASILNMQYLTLKDTNRTGSELTYSYQQIKNNKFIQFFLAHGYKLYNYSFFDFEGQPAPIRETFLPAKTRLLTSQTFLSRLKRDLWFNTVTLLKSKKSIRIMTYDNQRNNKHLYQLTWNIVNQEKAQPKFVYTHLMMPHYPYYNDKNGNELPFERLVEGNQVHKDDYIGYLQYTNKKILELIDHVQKSSASPPVIILMGDHGFRHFTEPVEKKYYFMNLLAVYFPDKNYSILTDSTSSVNSFREILNGQFSQKLPPLKDSTIYLRD